MYAPGATELAVERLSVKDQYETPAQLWRYAIDAFSLDRDAHASSLNAVLPAYSTREDTAVRAGARYWLNPAYGGHCVTIAASLAAHVWVDGCAVVALLPALLHTDWWHDYVMRADRIFYLREKVKFTNPFMEEVASDYMFSFVLVVWEPQPCVVESPWQPLSLPRAGPSDPGQLLRVRRCGVCGKYRVLPRYQSEPGGPFVCAALGDPHFAACEAPRSVWLSDV